MVNPFKMARKALDNARNSYDDYQNKRAVRTAEELKELKKRRLAAEGRAKIYRTRDLEKSKLKAAKKEQFQRSTGGKIAAGLKKELSKAKKNGSKVGTFNVGKNWG